VVSDVFRPPPSRTLRLLVLPLLKTKPCGCHNVRRPLAGFYSRCCLACATHSPDRFPLTPTATPRELGGRRRREARAEGVERWIVSTLQLTVSCHLYCVHLIIIVIYPYAVKNPLALPLGPKLQALSYFLLHS
jgi:antibiotic biosynthesis monooxygenase (ABM) superfamily enzyme